MKPLRVGTWSALVMVWVVGGVGGVTASVLYLLLPACLLPPGLGSSALASTGARDPYRPRPRRFLRDPRTWGRPGSQRMWPFEQRRALGRLRPGPPRRELQLLVSPPIWRVWVDGRAVSRTPGMPRSVHVGRGRHVVEFRHPRTFPLRFEVPAGSADRSLGGRLRWRPATLTVRVRPARAARRAAFRYLAPRFLEGRSTQPVNLPLTIRLGRRVRTRPRARIQIFARGYRHEERRVVLTPGARRTVSVRLRSLTPSRR